MNVTRAQVLAYRAATQGFGDAPPHDAVLALGMQDTPVGSAALALSVRGLPDRGLATVWSFRGAPHRHRGADLRSLARATWPLSDPDAWARLAALGSALKRSGSSGLDALTRTAEAVAAVLRPGTTKSDLSSGVTARVPAALSAWCGRCAATHVNDLLLRLAALPGGARIDQPSPIAFGPIPRWGGVPARTAGLDRLVRAYLTLHGPATRADVAAFLGTSTSAIALPGDLAEVPVDGRAAYLPPDRVDVLRNAARVSGVRLLAPSDPLLQARDRDLLVPDAARRKGLWTILGGPGALLVDGEIAGTWRARQSGRNGVAITVTPFGPPPRRGLDAEAERVAAVRGAASVTVTVDR